MLEKEESQDHTAVADAKEVELEVEEVEVVAVEVEVGEVEEEAIRYLQEPNVHL